jgi:4-oxalomesaconate hydratase
LRDIHDGREVTETMAKEIKILGIGAHVADVFGRAGGTIARYLQTGHKASIVALAYGERGEAQDLWRKPGITMSDVKRIKAEEAKAAAKTLGVDIRLLDFEDNPIIMDRERLYVLVDIIREVKPDILLTHWKDDWVNWDHATTGEWAVKAAWSASRLGLQTKHAAHQVKEIYMFMPSGLSDDIVQFRPDILIDISDTIERKKEVIKCFESQASEIMPYYTDYSPRYRGRQAGVQYAEAFVRFTRGYGSGSLKYLPLAD